MRKLLLKTVLLLLPVLMFLHQQANAQCTLTCPANTTVPAEAGKCGAIVNYTAPSIPTGCSGTQKVDTTFAFTGTQQIFVVPQGVTSVYIQTWGAQGGRTGACPNSGGQGGYAVGTLQVNGGDVLYVYVGGQPTAPATQFYRIYPGGYNGGGSYTYGGGGGGGASDVRAGDSSLGNRVIVAGGGGGGQYSYNSCSLGGAGGGLSGNNGGNDKFGSEGGGGGTQTGGGAAGYQDQAGTLGQGGGALNTGSNYAGGGGGYYGGGSSGGAGGGGGSGYVGGVTDSSMQTGVNSGNGKVQISYTTTTAAPKLVQTAGLASGAFFPVGTTTNTFALVSSNGDTLSKCSSTVTVTDKQKPVLTCPTIPLQCYNSNGSYTIPTLTATDNCGIQSTSYTITGATTRSGNDNDASGAFNPGVSTITWTVTDLSNYQSTCQTTITVNPQINVTIPDAKALSSGVSANTVYLGYAPASSLTLTANASGGSGGFTYKWSTGATTQSIKVSPTTTTTYTVTVKDASGCTATASRQVNVVDVRCGNKNDKVTVCHGGGTICINTSDVPHHLNHGDKLGTCGTAAMTNQMTSLRPQQQNLMVSTAPGVYPNPNNGQFTVQLNDPKANKAEVLIADAKGVIAERRQVQLTAGKQTLRFNLANKATGLYVVKVISEEGMQTIKVAVQR